MVASLSRPGGNATGVNFVIAELVAKRLGLLRKLVPTATRIAVLVNPADATRTATVVNGVEAAAHDLGLQVRVFNASTISEIDAAFTALARERTDALFVAPDVFLTSSASNSPFSRCGTRSQLPTGRASLSKAVD